MATKKKKTEEEYSFSNGKTTISFNPTAYEEHTTGKKSYGWGTYQPPKTTPTEPFTVSGGHTSITFDPTAYRNYMNGGQAAQTGTQQAAARSQQSAAKPQPTSWEDYYAAVDLDKLREEQEKLRSQYKMQGKLGDAARWIGSKAYGLTDTYDVMDHSMVGMLYGGKLGKNLIRSGLDKLGADKDGYLAEIMGRDETTAKLAELEQLYNRAETVQRYKQYEQTVADFEKKLDRTGTWAALESYRNPAELDESYRPVDDTPLPSADWGAQEAPNGTFDIDPDAYGSAINGRRRGQEKAMEGFAGTGITEEQVLEYLDAKTRLENKESYEEELAADMQRMADYDQGGYGTFGKIDVTLKNIPRRLAGGAAGSLSAAFDQMQGKPVDWYDPYVRPGQLNKETTEAITESIDAPFWQQAYQMGNSAVDSATVALLSRAGVPTWIGATMMGGSAAQQTMLEAKERGLDDAAAVDTGIAAGIAETLFEKVSLDAFIQTKAVDPGAGPGKKLLQTAANMAKQAGVEGSEEVFTSIANQAFDRMRNGGLSEYEENVRRYMTDGKSRNEAEKLATTDFCKQLGMDFLGGAVLGGLMGSVGTGINTLAENADARATYGADSAALVQEALELDPDNKTAQAAQRRLAEGKELSGGTIRALVAQNEAQIRKTQNTGTGETDSHGPTALGMTEATDTSSAAYGDTFPSRGRLETETEENSGRSQRPASTGANVTARREGELGNGGRAIYETLRDMAPELSDKAYRDAFTLAYETGRATAQSDAEQGLQTALDTTQGLGLSAEIVQYAYNAGREDVAWENENGARGTDSHGPAAIGMTEATEKGASYGTEGQQGIRVRDGGQRAAGAYSGGQGEAVVTDTGEAAPGRGRAGGAADGGAAEVRVAEKVRSSADLIGSTRGSRTDKLRMVTGNLSPAMEKAAAQARARGLTPYFYTGGYMTVDGETCRGFIRGNTVYIRADDPNYTADQIMRHEAGHDAIAKHEIEPAEVYETLLEKYGQEGLEAILDAYGEDYAGSGMTMDQIWEEVVCDSLGDMGVFAGDLSAVAPELAEVLNAVKDETRRQGTRRALEGRGQKNTAPGEGRMSFVRATDGEFRQADVMERNGASEAEIWKETGVIRDAAGNWVTEISDREAKYYPNGDAQFRVDHPEYARYQDLVEKFIVGTITENEMAEMQELRPTWSQEQKRLSERVQRGNATLGNVLQHDELFKRIPALRDVPFRVVEELGAWGQRGGDGIALSKDLDAALRKGTVLHEVQHEIQHQEERPSGANEEYWQDRINRGTAPRSHDSQVRDAEARRDAAWEQMDEETRKQVRAINRENLKAQETGDFTRWNEMDEAMRNSDQGELYEAYDDAMFDLRTATEYNRDMDARELYHNTAGEIEARLTESRREMTEEQRREKVPDFQKNKAVFAENTAGYVMSEDESASVKKQLRNNEKVLLQMEPVTTISYDGWDGLSKAAFVKKVFSMLRRSGLKVDRKGFGVIELTETDINRSLDYIRTAGEAAAYQAIPRVLKRGIQIDEHKDHKWRGYDTTTIAAPIEIDGVRVNMAVVVKMTKGYRYKVHRVLTPEGTTFHLPGKANAEPTTGGGITRVAYSRGGVAPPISSASMNSISDQSAKSNPQKDNGHKSRVGDSMETLQQENEALRGQVKAFRKALRATERKLADARESRDNWKNKATFSPERVGRELIRAYDGSVAESEIHEDVKKLIDYAARKDGITYEELKRLAAPAAARVVKSASVLANGEEAQTWENLKKHLWKNRTKVSQAAINDFTEWGAFWRENGRRLGLVTGKSGAPIDVAYAELGEKFGYTYFPESITNPADQLRRMAEVYGELQPSYENPYSVNMALATEHCANDLIDMVMAEVARGYKATYAGRLQEEVYHSRQHTEQLLERERARNRETTARQKYGEGIKRMANDFRQMILHPTDSRYAPIGLMKSCMDVALMLDTRGEREDTKSREMFNKQMRRIEDEYKALKESNDSDYALEYDEDFAGEVAKLREKLDGKAVRELTTAQLKDVYEVLWGIKETLRLAKYQISETEKISNYEVGAGIIRQQRTYDVRTRHNKAAVTAAAAMRRVANVERNVRRMCDYDDNTMLWKVYEGLNKGVRKRDFFTMEAEKLFERFQGKRMRESATKQRTYRIGGADVQMTEMQAMQIILTWEREATNGTTEHLQRGGARIPDAKLEKKGRYGEAQRVGQQVDNISQEDVSALYGTMDEWAKDYMDAAKKFFNEMAQKAINEATLQVKHRRMATTRNYIPFQVYKGTINKESEGVKFDATLEGWGSLKSIQEGASNTLVIWGLSDVINDHIGKVANIYGLMAPIKNFKKATGVRLMGETETAETAFVSEDFKLLQQAVDDLQTPRKMETHEVLDALQDAFVKATLLSNISVTIKQAASYSTAGLYLSQRALFPYQTTIVRLFGHDNGRFAQELFAEIDEHTAAHYMRRRGMSMQEIAMVAKDSDAVTRWLDEHVKNDALNPLKWIQNMDVATTAALWLATKKQVELDGLHKGDAGYWDAVTELYEKVLENTQPMYDALHRPEVQKKTDRLSRSLVMFQTQPLQNAGIIWDAVGNLEAAKRKGTGVKEARLQMTRAAGSQIASLAVFAAMSFLAYAVRNRLGRYKDDEEELTVESVVKRILMDMGTNGVNLLIPAYGSMVTGGIEAIVNKVQGKTTYDTLSVPLVDMVNDWINDVGNLTAHLSNLEEKGSEIGGDIHVIAMDAASAFGIPAENVYNIFRGIVGNVGDISGHPVDWATDEENTVKGMKAAWNNGHFTTAKNKMDGIIKDKMKAGKTEKEARSAVMSSMTSTFKPMYLKAYRENNRAEMERIRRILVECGLYSDVNKTLATWTKD